MKKFPKVLTGPFHFTRQLTPEQTARLATAATVEVGIAEGFRSYEVNRAEIDEEKRIVPCVFATERKVERYFGFEVLDCTAASVRMDRLKVGIALLADHDSRQQIGVIEPGSIEFGADKKARCRARFSDSEHNPRALREWDEVKKGIRGLFSVGYEVHRLVLVEESEDGPTYRATDWEPMEISLVSIPADIDCQLGRATEENNLLSRVTVELSPNKPNEMTITRLARAHGFRVLNLRNADNGGNATGGTGGQGEQREQKVDPKAFVAAERERINDLRNLKRDLFPHLSDDVFNPLLERWINGETTASEAIQEIKERKLASGGGAKSFLTGGTPGPGNGTDTSDQRQQSPSFTSAVRTIGSEFTSSDTYKRAAQSGLGRGQSISVLLPDRVSARATLTTTTAGLNISNTQVLGIPPVQIGTERASVIDFMGQGTTTLGSITYMRETAAPTNAATAVAEGGTKPEATFALEEVTVSVRKFAVWTKVTEEVFADAPTLQSYVDARLRWMVEQREEDQVLNASGSSPNMQGILNVTGIQTQPLGTDSRADAFHKAITKVRVVGFAEPDLIVAHPNDWQDIALDKDANGQYLLGGPAYAPYGNGLYTNVMRLWGLPVVATTNLPEGTAIVGAFRQDSMFIRRQGLEMAASNSDGDNFIKNLITIRAESRGAALWFRNKSFCTVTGL